MALRLSIIDWVLSIDPALSRARMGARVVLGIGLSVGVLVGLHFAWMPLPPIAYGLAIILSIEGGVAVRDQTQLGQLITRLMGGLASLASILLASSLQEYRLVSGLTFLLIVFLASLARVFGPRGFAIGMFAFTSYFMAAYLRPDYGQLIPAAIALAVAISLGQFVRTVVLPDDRGRDLLQALIALQGRGSDMLVRLALLARAQVTTDEDRVELRELQERLKDVALMAEGLLPRNADGAIEVTDQAVADVALAIFDLHLAIESAVILSIYNPAPFGLVHGVIEKNDELVAEWRALARDVQDQHLQECIRAFEAVHLARSRMDGLIETGMQDNFHSLTIRSASAGAGQKPDFSLKNPVVKAAVQITIASGIAMFFGLMLSRDRWFWAVLTAFLVFTNTKSRGDTALRAFQRSIGTVLGITVGLGISVALQGNFPLSIAAAGIGIFLAFYALQASYAVMTFFVSIVLCIIYGLIGTLTLDLLRLRIEETLIGSIAGTAVAFTVFPAKTRQSLDGALRAWYGRLTALLEAAKQNAPQTELVELSRQIDAAYRDLSLAARPLGTSWSIVTKPGHVRQTLALYLASTYWARVYARRDLMPVPDDLGTEEASLDELVAQVERLAQLGADPFYRSHAPRLESPELVSGRKRGPRHGLNMIGTVLARLES